MNIINGCSMQVPLDCIISQSSPHHFTKWMQSRGVFNDKGVADEPAPSPPRPNFRLIYPVAPMAFIIRVSAADPVADFSSGSAVVASEICKVSLPLRRRAVLTLNFSPGLGIVRQRRIAKTYHNIIPILKHVYVEL